MHTHICCFAAVSSTIVSSTIVSPTIVLLWCRVCYLTAHFPSGCLFAELCTGQPLFPGESDVDQLWHIVRAVGSLPTCFAHCRGRRNGVRVRGMRQPRVDEMRPLDGRRMPQMDDDALQLLQVLGGAGWCWVVVIAWGDAHKTTSTLVKTTHSQIVKQQQCIPHHSQHQLAVRCPRLFQSLSTQAALQPDPKHRPSAEALMRMSYFADVESVMRQTRV